jgi:hypothetical protein
MADDTTNGESQPHSVLGSLPATRPQRLRREVTVAKTQGRGPRPAKAKAPRPRPAAPKSRRPVQGAAAKTAKPAPRRTKPVAVSAGAPRRTKPVAVSAGAPRLERRRAATPPPRPIDPPRGTELVTTAIQATGELARIGLTLGGRALKRAVDRLPHP